MRAVWVVESRVQDGRWVAMLADVTRRGAWFSQRGYRARWPEEKFRVVKYVPAKPKKRAAESAKERR